MKLYHLSLRSSLIDYNYHLLALIVVMAKGGHWSLVALRELPQCHQANSIEYRPECVHFAKSEKEATITPEGSILS